MKQITFFFTLTLCFLIVVTNNIKAQDYKSAIGLRLGYPASISYKHFMNEKGAVEGTIGFRNWSGFARYVGH